MTWNYTIDADMGGVSELAEYGASFGTDGWREYLPSQSSAGVAVTQETSLGLSAVYRAVDLISTVEASLPIRVYKRQRDGDKEHVENSPIEYFFNHDANEEIDAYTFRKTSRVHELLWGFSLGIKRESGSDIACDLVHPSRVQVERARSRELGNIVLFHVSDEWGHRETLERSDVLYTLGMSHDGITGVSRVRYGRESLGEGLAVQRYGGAFFANDARPGIIVSTASKKAPEAVKQFQHDWNERYRGPQNRGKAAVITGDEVRVTEVGIPPEDAQYLQSREHTVDEVSRWFGVPPHLLYDLRQAKWANVFQQGLDFLTYSMRGYLQAVVAGASKAFLTREDKLGGVFITHETDSLLQLDVETRTASYTAGVQGGWFSVNDIRTKLDMPKIEGGDAYAITGPDEPPEEPPAEEPSPGPGVSDGTTDRIGTLHDTLAVVVRDAIARPIKRFARMVDEARKTPRTFTKWQEEKANNLGREVVESSQASIEALRAAGRGFDCEMVYAQTQYLARRYLDDLHAMTPERLASHATAIEDVEEWPDQIMRECGYGTTQG